MPVLKLRLLLCLPLLVLLEASFPAPEERDVDLEDYNYKQEPAAGIGGQSENPLAALQAGIRVPDFNTEELEALLRDLPIPDDANQAIDMTMAEAVEVNYMLYKGLHLYIACYIIYINAL